MGRESRILEAAADLIARHGYLGVSLSDIGAAAGIVGSGIYRHFNSKGAILVELFDRVIDHLVLSAEKSVAASPDPRITLDILITGHVDFVFQRRALCKVYVREAANLPETDQMRLRWKQRHYVALWEDALCTVRPEVSPQVARILVRSAVSSIHSALNFTSTLETDAVAGVLRGAACRVLDLEPPTAPSP